MASKDLSPVLRVSAYQAFKAGFFAMLGVIVANLFLGAGAFIIILALGVGIPVGLGMFQSDKLTSAQPAEARPASAVLGARAPSSTGQQFRTDRKP